LTIDIFLVICKTESDLFINYLSYGRIRLSIGSEEYDVTPGNSWCIPSGVEHGAQILEDSVAIEVFSPVREDYLPKERDQQ
jgi:quercetin dioxygenase-like cupin family protein